jgi:hypothetical protein
MKAVEFHPDAAEEAREAALHYEDIRAGLGAPSGQTWTRRWPASETTR